MSHVTMGISLFLFAHLKTCLELGVKQQRAGKTARHGINGLCDTGFAAPSIAVAAWEALLHECLLSDFARAVYINNPLWKFPEEAFMKRTLLEKTLFVPDFLFNRIFNKGAQPYQNFRTLVSVRNEFVRFKSSYKPPRGALKYLEGEGVLITSEQVRNGTNPNCDYPWPAKFAGTEMIRWSINTIADMAQELLRLSDGKIPLDMCRNFHRIELDEVKSMYLSIGINIDE